jgi:hypothetical protein
MLLPLLLASAPAWAGELEKAEHTRVSEEMRRLAQRNAWYGVDQGYRKLEALKGEVITPKEHLLGAQAAQALGDITSARVRFVRARDGGLAAEAAPILEVIDANYGQVTVRFEKKYAGPGALVSLEPPFAPDQRASLDFVTKTLATRANYEGLLPLGPYTLDGKEFRVAVGQPAAITLGGAVAKADPGASPAGPAPARAPIRFGPRASLGVAYTIAGALNDAGMSADAGIQASPFAGMGARVGVGGQVLLSNALGVYAELGYHDLFGAPARDGQPLAENPRYVLEGNALHMGYGWLAVEARVGPVWIAAGPTYGYGKASITGADGYCAHAADACADAPAAAGVGGTYQKLEGTIRAAGAAGGLSVPVVPMGGLATAISLQGGAQTDTYRWYPWGALAVTVAPSSKKEAP